MSWIVSVGTWVALVGGALLIVGALVRFDEIGRLVGMGAGLVISSTVTLARHNGTLGDLLSMGGSVLTGVSFYLFYRDIRRRQRRGTGKRS